MVDLTDFDLEKSQDRTMVREIYFRSSVIHLTQIVITAEENSVTPSRCPLFVGTVILVASLVIFVGGIECERALLEAFQLFTIQRGELKLIELSELVQIMNFD